VVHFTHLGALIALVSTSRTAREDLDALTVVGGGLAYLFIAAMTATAFDHTAAWLGAPMAPPPYLWSLLHLDDIFLQLHSSRLSITRIHTVRCFTSGSHGDANLRPGSEASLGAPGLARQL